MTDGVTQDYRPSRDINFGVRPTFADSAHESESSFTPAEDDEHISYQVFGEGDLTLVFVHGGQCERTFWKKQVDYFAPMFRLLTLDLPGHGQSSGGRTLWSMEGFGNDVARVVRGSAAASVVLIGHSMGGAVVIEAARQLGDAVVGLVVVDALHQPGTAPPVPPQLSDETLREAMRRGMFGPDSDAATQMAIINTMISFPRERAAAMREAFSGYDAKSALGAIPTISTTFLMSALRPVNAMSIREAHPRARLLIFRKAGHFLMLENAAAFNAILHGEILAMKGEVSSA